MICSKCGHENPDDAKFCGNCASPLGEQPAQASPPPPAETAAPMPPSQPSMSMDAQPPAKKGFPAWAWVLIVLFVLCGCGVPVLAAILFPVFSQANIAAKKTFSVSQGKQVGTSMLIYQTDFDDLMPSFSSADEVTTKLIPYFSSKKEDVTSTDSTPMETLEEHSRRMIWNTDASGKSATELNMKSWMFYDPTKYGTYQVLTHFDTSTKSYEPDAFQQELAIPFKQ